MNNPHAVFREVVAQGLPASKAFPLLNAAGWTPAELVEIPKRLADPQEHPPDC